MRVHLALFDNRLLFRPVRTLCLSVCIFLSSGYLWQRESAKKKQGRTFFQLFRVRYLGRNGWMHSSVLVNWTLNIINMIITLNECGISRKESLPLDDKSDVAQLRTDSTPSYRSSHVHKYTHPYIKVIYYLCGKCQEFCKKKSICFFIHGN